MANNFGGRKKDPVWNKVDILSNGKAKCKNCSQEISARVLFYKSM
jgi:hypothetical protein